MILQLNMINNKKLKTSLSTKSDHAETHDIIIQRKLNLN